MNLLATMLIVEGSLQGFEAPDVVRTFLDEAFCQKLVAPGNVVL